MQDHAGEVKYVTLAGEGDFVEECDAYVEFGTLKGVLGALKMENLTIKEKTFTVRNSFRVLRTAQIQQNVLGRMCPVCNFKINTKAKDICRGCRRNCGGIESLERWPTSIRLLWRTDWKFG